jgi:membrane protease YdiL (CAAX protease family)
MFCPRCHDEFREGFTRCQACDVALVESLTAEPGETESEDGPLVTVGRYFSPIEAHGRRMALEQAGLRAWVSDEAIGATYGVAVGVGLQVRAEDAATARAILDADPPAELAEPAAPDDLAEPTDAGAAEPSEPVAPAQQEPSHEEGPRPRTFEMLELVGVLLVAFVYPVVAGLVSEPDEPPIGPRQLAAGTLGFVGLTLIVWMLLKRGRQGRLAPMPMPRSPAQWGREVLVGVLLFLALYVVLWPLLADLLDRVGVADVPSRDASFFRQPGMAPVFFVASFFGAAYEEVVFRAFLLSRLGLVLGKRHGWGVLAAAALFALMHGYPLGSTLAVFANGLVWGLVYVRSRSLPRLVVSHWLYNLAVMNHYLHAA